MASEKMPWTSALALLISAGVAAGRGAPERAVSLYADAAVALDRVDMAHYAQMARFRHGELIGGEEGKALVDNANSWMTAQTIKKPERWAAMLAPAPAGD
jgi:hypothetical protein